MNQKWIIVALASLVLAVSGIACNASEKEKKDVTMGGEFSTLLRCVEAIESKVGPLDILIDKPDEVTGRTSEGKLFSCKKKETGTRGTFYEGWYLTAEES